MTAALLVIDVQNDYFPDGAFPLWNTAAVLDATVTAIERARERGEPVVLVQHVAATPDSPLFKANTPGVEIHPRILAAAPSAPVVVKQFADSFHQTPLSGVLAERGIDHLRIAGMMTQNCVTHTALSHDADKFRVSILSDCTTTVDPAIHHFALNALSTRTTVVTDVESA
ncbi:MAG: cysteine hydrolase [Proteobacteria bacterium]|nr:cysteine hydrolase [Pseudomonadota bacterium]